ncbi:hypothetical protein [Neobacillus sp. PS3-40]|uniref:hypothetical protein n=1 Tax=Neobacillus sp. PS3-40 TaxID=3070679 RepID=UPI0027DEDDCB|nr:hypothetical protein [Neobacillus sp. PS3-40]WML45404.1 hypothetical protein RCG20_05740 [Neobacillus sp. PS3-40]
MAEKRSLFSSRSQVWLFKKVKNLIHEIDIDKLLLTDRFFYIYPCYSDFGYKIEIVNFNIIKDRLFDFYPNGFFIFTGNREIEIIVVHQLIEEKYAYFIKKIDIKITDLSQLDLITPNYKLDEIRYLNLPIFKNEKIPEDMLNRTQRLIMDKPVDEGEMPIGFAYDEKAKKYYKLYKRC